MVIHGQLWECIVIRCNATVTHVNAVLSPWKCHVPWVTVGMPRASVQPMVIHDNTTSNYGCTTSNHGNAMVTHGNAMGVRDNL